MGHGADGYEAPTGHRRVALVAAQRTPGPPAAAPPPGPASPHRDQLPHADVLQRPPDGGPRAGDDAGRPAAAWPGELHGHVLPADLPQLGASREPDLGLAAAVLRLDGALGRR